MVGMTKIWTIGHSTRLIGEFIELLHSHAIKTLVDIRTLPGSRNYPQFNKETLEGLLLENGIEYIHMKKLGGLRRPTRDSHNRAWRNPMFRGYADYMETSAFKEAVEELLEIALTRATAIMCAEVLWWRCHRSLIADYLKIRGIEVIHIINLNKSIEHPYTSAAIISEGHLSYELIDRSGILQ
jgi:uncharacterized protein (DUF488 family)